MNIETTPTIYFTRMHIEMIAEALEKFSATHDSEAEAGTAYQASLRLYRLLRETDAKDVRMQPASVSETPKYDGVVLR